jgi:hypothetical protein
MSGAASGSATLVAGLLRGGGGKGSGRDRKEKPTNGPRSKETQGEGFCGEGGEHSCSDCGEPSFRPAMIYRCF